MHSCSNGDHSDENVLDLNSGLDWDRFDCEFDLENFTNVPVLTATPSYEEFYVNYLCSNTPCILSCELTRDWSLNDLWFRSGRELDFDYLKHKYGGVEVPVYNCGRPYFDSHHQSLCTLSQYLTYLKTHTGHETLYAKDWHLHRQHRQLYSSERSFYRTPHLFCSDWLNEYLEESRLADGEPISSTGELSLVADRAIRSLVDDYRFVYIGNAGTWTPLHCDVFGSFSWSANVGGAKVWLLLPPGQEQLLRVNGASQLPADVSQQLQLPVTGGDSSCSWRQLGDGRLRQCGSSGVRYVLTTQHCGQVMFVPSGWYHQVWNVCSPSASPASSAAVVVSVNHNWFNGSSVRRVWRHLCGEMARVTGELSDTRPRRHGPEWRHWRRQCQLVLRALAGVSLPEFGDLLAAVTRRRLEALRSRRPLLALDGRRYSLSHVTADLRQLATVLAQVAEYDTQHWATDETETDTTVTDGTETDTTVTDTTVSDTVASCIDQIARALDWQYRQEEH